MSVPGHVVRGCRYCNLSLSRPSHQDELLQMRSSSPEKSHHSGTREHLLLELRLIQMIIRPSLKSPFSCAHFSARFELFSTRKQTWRPHWCLYKLRNYWIARQVERGVQSDAA